MITCGWYVDPSALRPPVQRLD